MGWGIGAGVDWQGTGAMLQGWATLAGAVAVVYAANRGANVFAQWRRQKLEELRIERAERILTAAYRGKFALNVVRGAFFPAPELDAATERLKQDGTVIVELGPKSASGPILAQATLTRIERFNSVWDEIEACQPLARAYFGAEIEGHLQTIISHVILVQTTAREYARDDVISRDYREGLRRKLWNVSEGDDKVMGAVDAAVKAVEDECLPIIRAEVERMERESQPHRFWRVGRVPGDGRAGKP